VKRGDRVLITRGRAKGQLGTIEEVELLGTGHRPMYGVEFDHPGLHPGWYPESYLHLEAEASNKPSETV
jgi:hypothetical protein